MRMAPASAIAFATSSKNGLFSSILWPVCLLAGVKVANDVIPDHSPVRLFDVEVENARPFVIDPDDGVIMIGHCGLLARIGA